MLDYNKFLISELAKKKKKWEGLEGVHRASLMGYPIEPNKPFPMSCFPRLCPCPALRTHKVLGDPPCHQVPPYTSTLLISHHPSPAQILLQDSDSLANHQLTSPPGCPHQFWPHTPSTRGLRPETFAISTTTSSTLPSMLPVSC